MAHEVRSRSCPTTAKTEIITYNHVFQTNRFGNARLGNLTFSVPF